MKLVYTSELAEVAGIHAGDGYLRNDGKRREWDISGSVDEKGYYENHVIPLFSKLFNMDIKGRYFPGRNTYGFVIREKNIVKLAHEVLGFPYGNKSLSVRVPEFVFYNTNNIIHFLRGYFDTDGHVGCGKKYGSYSNFKKTHHCYPRIMFSTVSNSLFDAVRILLQRLKVRFCSCRHKPLKTTENLKYKCEINGPVEVSKFMMLMEPKNQAKTSRYRIWQKHGFCPTNISYGQRVKILMGHINPHIFYNGPVA